MKKCKRCDEWLPLSDFHKHPKSKLHPVCKKCRKKIHAEYYKKNRGKLLDNLKVRRLNSDSHRRDHLKREYGITIEEYGLMFSHQQGKCAICGKPSKKILQVDHCHRTGRIRALLCFTCNAGLGLFSDSIDLMKSAIIYLEGWQSTD